MSNSFKNSPFVYLIIALSFIGFIDAAFLAVKFFTGGPIPCSFLDGCDYVTTSKYSKILGVPVALLGAMYYLSVFILSLAYKDNGRKAFFKMAFALICVGFAMSIWFLYAQIFILHAFCLYCIFSGIASAVLFLSSLYIYKQNES